MRLLFITSSRIGDAILSTGILNHYIGQYPDIKITVACGNLVSGFFRAVPQVEAVIDIKKQSWNRHWLKLWRRVVATRWDIVVDVRNSSVSRTIRAKERYMFGPRIDKNTHKVEQMAQIINVSPPPAPRLWFDQEARGEAEKLVPAGAPVLGIGPAANWRGKTWPEDRFIELIGRLTTVGAPMENWRVAVFAAPGERQQAEPVLESVDRDKRIDLMARVTPLEAAACLERCAFYIGNDSGLMHASAAVGTPTLGLFGPSWPHLYRPWGTHTAYVRTPKNYDELIDYDGYKPHSAPSLMTELTVDAVEKAAIELLGAVKA